MGKKPSFIEINGKRYEAATGQFVGIVKKISGQAKRPLANSVDGLSKVASRPGPAKKAASEAAMVKKKPAAKNRPKRPAQTIHSRRERSYTLMRRIVRRPAIQEKKDNSAPKIPRNYLRTINPARMTRAMAVGKNHKIRHFGRPAISTRASRASENHAPPPAGGLMGKKSMANHHAGATTATVSRPLPSMVTSVTHHQLERLLDDALTKADAHKQFLKRQISRRNLGSSRFMPRWLRFILGLLAVLAIGGFFAWQNIPQIPLKVAAIRTHVNASLPSYTPPGFSFSAPIKYESGAVTINFKANADPSRTYSVTQQASAMESTSLANSLPKNSQVQTSQVRGTTIYIYGPSNDASWVNNGVRYTISDNARLDSDQLLKIADSL